MERFAKIWSIFCLVMGFLMLFTLGRLSYVSGVYKDWNNKIYQLRSAQIKAHSPDYDKYSYDTLYDSVYGFNKMMFHFWEWRLKDMVENKQLFDYVQRESAKIKQ